MRKVEEEGRRKKDVKPERKNEKCIFNERRERECNKKFFFFFT